jgi:hypothetical protein
MKVRTRSTFTSSKPFSTRNTKLKKSSHPTTIHWVDSEYQASFSTMRGICSELQVILLPPAASFLMQISQLHSSENVTAIQQPGLQSVVYSSQIKFKSACNLFTHSIQCKETNVYFFGISCGWPCYTLKYELRR